MPPDARRTVTDDRLDRLRGDLAALRAKTARDFPVAQPDAEPPDVRGGDHAAGNGRMPSRARTPSLAEPDGGPGPQPGPAAAPRTRSHPPAARPGRRRVRAPRPPRRNPLRVLALRAHRPPERLRVPTPVPVRRRPAHIAPPRWPLWTPPRVAIAVAIGVPAVLQLAYRLARATAETSVLMGADPSRADYLRAATGVAGGGATLALTVAALAVVRGRPGYLAAAVGVVGAFVALPWMAYTATAGIVQATVPGLADAIAPTDWAAGGWLALAFWLSAAALVAAVGDLLWRSVAALGTLFDR